MDEQVSAHHVTNTAPPPDITEKKYNFPILIFFRDARLVFEMDSLGREILRIAVPAAMALAADPLASLIDTAFIGHLGPVEIAAVGVSIAIFNQASKVTIFPLVSITTSFVAEEETVQRINNETVKGEDLEGGSRSTQDEEMPTCKSPTNGNVVRNKEKRHIPSASTALVVGGILGIIQAVVLLFAANTLLHVMGVKAGSAMLIPAHKYLTLRSLGSPAVLLSLAMQGVFRGLKDTKTPLYATGEYIKLSGTPFLSYLITVILLVKLMKMIHLLPPSMKDLQFSRFLKNGFLLLAKVIAATICVTFAASRAARLGSTPMAAFQICLQVWLTSSLLADGLAVAGQAIIATAFAEKDYHKATSAATRVLQMSFLLGLGLAGVVGAGLYFGDTIFSKDPIVLHIISIGIPFVAATQPLNSIAFVFDGVNFGASDFRFSSYSMVLVAMATLPAVYLLSNSGGFIGIWVALTIFMGLRTFVGIWRMGTATGPWQFLKGPTSS
ncbi:Protein DETOXIFICATION 43 [Linum perenne]